MTWISSGPSVVLLSVASAAAGAVVWASRAPLRGALRSIRIRREPGNGLAHETAGGSKHARGFAADERRAREGTRGGTADRGRVHPSAHQIGRASCRERV